MRADRRSAHAILSEIVAAVMWGPKTEREIDEAVIREDMVGMAKLRGHLNHLRASGVIRVREYNDRGCEVFELQSKPFALADAPRPDGYRGKVRGRGPKYELNGKKMTTEALARLAGVGEHQMRKRLRRMPPEQAVALKPYERQAQT